MAVDLSQRRFRLAQGSFPLVRACTNIQQRVTVYYLLVTQAFFFFLAKVYCEIRGRSFTVDLRMAFVSIPIYFEVFAERLGHGVSSVLDARNRRMHTSACHELRCAPQRERLAWSRNGARQKKKAVITPL